MAWSTVTRGSAAHHNMKLQCKDEPSEQLNVKGLVPSALILQPIQDFVGGTRRKRRPHQQAEYNKEEEISWEEDDDGVGDELAMNPAEKKRRLTLDQVKFLEMSFSMDLKLEPERKAMIAKQLGLRPRQVAIWFQNRRARWKNKQLEHDFEALKARHEAVLQENGRIVQHNGALLEENKRLQEEVAQLKVLVQDQPESGGGAMEKWPSPDSDSDVESGSMKEQKSEVVDVHHVAASASPAKSEDSQSYTSSSLCPIIAEATVLAMAVEEAPTTTISLKFEPDVALSPSEELLGFINNPWLFQHIATGGYQFHHHMEDLYSSSTWDHHLYGWGGQCDP